MPGTALARKDEGWPALTHNALRSRRHELNGWLRPHADCAEAVCRTAHAQRDVLQVDPDVSGPDLTQPASFGIARARLGGGWTVSKMESS